MVLVGCATQPPPAPTATAMPTATTAPRSIPTAPRPTPTPTLAPTGDLKTFHAQVLFDTYETEETVQLELGRLPGIASINVTQLDITVQYDPSRLSEDEILRTLRDNPEVRIKDDTRAGQ